MIKKHSITKILLLLFLTAEIALGSARKLKKGTQYPDFSTPEKTVATLYEAIKREDIETAQECHIPKMDGFGPKFERYRILKTRIIREENGFVAPVKPGDVEVTTEGYLKKTTDPWDNSYILRRTNDGWKIIDSVDMSDGNFPPEGPYDEQN